MLTRAQSEAIAFLEAYVAERVEPLDAGLLALEKAQVAVHFHPDRVSRSGLTVAQGLLLDGAFRTQFETGLSAGSLTAYPGGDRDRWEQHLFGGAYHRDGVGLDERPKYGALQLAGFPDGPAPRFGSCYLLLKPEVNFRCTLTFAGSQEGNALEQSGSFKYPQLVLGALLQAARRDGQALGIRQEDFIGQLAVPKFEAGRALDSFVEVQVHGPVRLERDVQAVWADPAFRNDPDLEALCRHYSLPLCWHPGFTMLAVSVPEEFRGPKVALLARQLAPNGLFDAATIGRAESQFRRDPQSWGEWGNDLEVLQLLKQLWHVLVQYGQPRQAH
jgi:hypothetical protein